MTVLFQASAGEPISSRLEHWRQVVGETFGPALLRPPSRAHVPRRLAAGDVGAVRVSELWIDYPAPSPDRCRAARTLRLIRQADPEPERYRVDLAVRGPMVVEQDGREAALEAGDFTLVDWSRPARWATASEVSAIAARWGLVDPAHFSRLFRAAYGLPPQEYRRTMGRASGPG